MRLDDLGFDEWFAAQAAELCQQDWMPARICAVDRGAYLLRSPAGEALAELAGRLAYKLETPADLPCVGDWVAAQYFNDDSQAIIHQIFSRKTCLCRKRAGASADIQMIAANLDTAFIVQACHFDFNPRRLERYLAMAAEGQVEAIVILTKTDLIDPDELEQKLAAIAAVSRTRVFALSNVSGAGFAEFKYLLQPGRTYCLLGSSGVGKTTLINRLLGRETFETGALSATGEGTHTTSRRQLIVLNRGALLIDTPGMRELGLVGASVGVDQGFAEVLSLAADCRYADCSHQGEPGCAVAAALEHGELSAERYASYLKLSKESAYNELTYLDKRRKDKAFGRFIKSVKKQLKD